VSPHCRQVASGPKEALGWLWQTSEVTVTALYALKGDYDRYLLKLLYWVCRFFLVPLPGLDNRYINNCPIILNHVEVEVRRINIMDNLANDHKVITFLVKNLERSSRFYNECLGLLLEEEEPGLYVQFDLGKRSLRLMRGGEQNETVPGGQVLRISINDIDKMSEYFTCRSIAFLRLKDAFGAGYLQVQDPDGHKIILKQKC